MYNFHISRYYNGNSLIHNINPFCKIICLLIFTTMVLFTNNILLLFILLLFVSILISISNVPLLNYIKSFKYILLFSIFLLIINIIFNDIYTSIVSIMKLILFIMYSTLILYTTKPNDITYGLEKLLNPLNFLGIDVKSLSLTISLAIRFIPTIFIEAEKIYRSQVSRGLNFTGSLKEKINKLLSLIIPIFNISLIKSESISNILDLRLYSNNRTRYRLYKITSLDKDIVTIHVFMLLLLIVIGVNL